MSILNQNLKRILACLVAFVILSLLFTFYGLIPVHIDNPDGNTDYIWPPNARWMKMTEGVSWGRFDAKGFNNKSVIENPDILLVGSSHMEAMNIKQDKTIASQLNQQLNGRFNVYNLGISGHHFFKTCQYLPKNIDLYKQNVLKAIIIETSTLDVTQKDVDAIISQSIKKTPSHAHGLIGKLQKNPFLRTLYFQSEHSLPKIVSPPKLYNYLKKQRTKQQNVNQKKTIMTVDDSAYLRLFLWLESLEKENHVKIFIFYHPFETLKQDGTISFDNSQALNVFKKAAIEHNVTVIDMTKSFEQMFYEDHRVPHGFSTGKLGVGHLNAYGHAAVAKELVKVINDCDNKGALLP